MSEQQSKIRAIRGVRDILPPTSALWNRVEQAAHDIFSTYGFGEIRLPIIEQTDLFARSIGSDTDVVSKEMYTFQDQPRKLPEPGPFVVAEHYTAVIARDIQRDDIPLTPSNQSTVMKLLREVENLKEASALSEGGRASEAYLRWALLLQEIQLGDLITLRPEATASVCRAYIENGMLTLPGNVKLYYMGPMFRRERPQKGRYRQFYQIGAEVLGQSDAPGIDAELIEMLRTFFERIGLVGTALSVNSIGCRDCRPKYVELLREELRKVKDQLGADSQRRIETNPLRVLDSKVPEEQPIIEKLPRIADHLCEACRAHFAELQEQLNLRGIRYEINWRLVRGLDYYTRTTFEITAPGLGSQNAICGGGRYDGLVELLGGPPTKAIGFAIGTDRVILALQDAGKGDSGARLDVFVAWMGKDSYPTAVRLARVLREQGISVEVPASEMKFGKALGLADKLGARHALIIGGDEVASGNFTLKCLADSEQKKLAEAELVTHLKDAQGR